MSRRILVKVSLLGEITVEAEGFMGKGCEAATHAIEEALGKPKSRLRKPSFWRRPNNHQQTQNLGGES